MTIVRDDSTKTLIDDLTWKIRSKEDAIYDLEQELRSMREELKRLEMGMGPTIKFDSHHSVYIDINRVRWWNPLNHMPKDGHIVNATMPGDLPLGGVHRMYRRGGVWFYASSNCPNLSHATAWSEIESQKAAA